MVGRKRRKYHSKLEEHFKSSLCFGKAAFHFYLPGEILVCSNGRIYLFLHYAVKFVDQVWPLYIRTQTAKLHCIVTESSQDFCLRMRPQHNPCKASMGAGELRRHYDNKAQIFFAVPCI